ncbi:hypothetical protein [Jeotgalibacillus proteolyticus]|uniref:Uncharacterized protein n=1 Tax=Jeotgalibacillus proteolyticus TaxID=2082395 RepID=A0A2S5GD62_9BACL|nr:hypothetical protein [Jeotgalibacillus proteolyticus]PPA70977.1 hypothetical protein C4B60_09345 [Jeotgalibacillus proteolyticus]
MRVLKLLIGFVVLTFMLGIGPIESAGQFTGLDGKDSSFKIGQSITQDKAVQFANSSSPPKKVFLFEKPFFRLSPFSSGEPDFAPKRAPVIVQKGDADGFLTMIKYHSDFI